MNGKEGQQGIEIKSTFHHEFEGQASLESFRWHLEHRIIRLEGNFKASKHEEKVKNMKK